MAAHRWWLRRQLFEVQVVHGTVTSTCPKFCHYLTVFEMLRAW